MPSPTARSTASIAPRSARHRVVPAGFNLAVVLGLAGPFVYVGHGLPLVQILAGIGALILAHVALNGLVEGRPWAVALDWPPHRGRGRGGRVAVRHDGRAAAGVAVAASVLVVSLASRLFLLPPQSASAHADGPSVCGAPNRPPEGGLAGPAAEGRGSSRSGARAAR